MFSISGKKKKNSKWKIEINFFRSGLFFTVGRERGNKNNFIFGLINCKMSAAVNVEILMMSRINFLLTWKLLKLIEPHHEKTRVLPIQKQRRRSAVQ